MDALCDDNLICFVMSDVGQRIVGTPLDPLSDIEMTDQGVYFNYESMQQNDGKIPKPETQKKAFRSVSFNFDKTYDPYQNRGSFPPAGY